MLNPIASLRRVLSSVADRFAKPQPAPADEEPTLTEFQRLLNSAEAGNALAQHQVALRFQIGAGVPIDRTEAAHWFRRAAEQGDPNAWLKLGACYCSGVGVSRNPEQAVACFEAAAKLHLPEGQLQLGYCYQHGIGVSRDLALAEGWYLRAKRGGNGQADGQLAQLREEREAWKEDDGE